MKCCGTTRSRRFQRNGRDSSEVGNPLGLRPADFYSSLPNFGSKFGVILSQDCKLGNLQVPRLVHVGFVTALLLGASALRGMGGRE